MTLLAIAIAVLGGGGFVSLLSWRARWGSWVAVASVVVACVLGETSAVRGLLHPRPEELILPWAIPYGTIHVAIDPLSSFFLAPLFALSALAAIYGRSYWGAKNHGASWFAFNLLVASMASVIVARQAVFFLVSWEVMSLSAYALVTLDHQEAEVRRAGWVYLVATHLGAAALLAMFLLFARHAGSFDFDRFAMAAPLPLALRLVLFGLALVGFGIKAGIVPLHVWLPEAHAAAPSHVSAVMSGVMVKVGVYGLLRLLVMMGPPLAPPPWLGPSLVVLGLAGGLLGISLALYQRDIKRALAYSTVENVGIILLGVGVGLWGVASHRPVVAALAMTGALMHVWNHALMKGLMFLGAGSVVHGTGTRDLEQLGGLVKRMPRTTSCMIVGALAIAALPPLNGFVGEWLIYLGLAHGAIESSGAVGVAASLAFGVLSFIGALAVFSFVRLIGVGLLGQPRAAGAASAHESSAGLTAPMIALAAACVAAALVPQVLARATLPVAAQLMGAPPDGTPVHSLATLGALDAALIVVLLVAGAIALRALRSRAVAQPTWACGYAAPTPRMQYTGRSFAELMAERLLPRRLGPSVAIVAPSDLFPGPSSFGSTCADPVTRGVYEPFIAGWGDRFMRLRWLQQGVLQVYLLYIVLAVIAGLTWVSFLSWGGP